MHSLSNTCYSYISHNLGRRVFALIFMLSIVTGFTVRGRLFNRFGRLQSMLSSSKAVSATHHPSYDKLEDFQIKEYGLSGTIYSHKKSGAQVMSFRFIH